MDRNYFCIKNDTQEHDPWNNKNKKIKKNTLFDFLKKISSKLFYKKKDIKKNSSKNNFVKIKNQFIILFAFSIFFALFFSGFYTIKESDRGVVFRFGKYNRIVNPGLNWRPVFIEQINSVNVETIREQITNGMMLTADENVIQVEMNVQYQIINPAKYLFNVVNPDYSLREAMDSTVRGIIGKSIMEQVLTKQRTFIRNETKKELEEVIKPYNMGIMILDVNFQTARPPEPVKAAFDDVIAAREEEEKTIREAQAYRNEVLPLAKGNAQKLIEEAIAYKSSIVLKAEGEVASFIKILPKYRFAPKITKERLYIETMEKVLHNTKKILISNKTNNIFVFPIENNNKIEQKNNVENSQKIIQQKTFNRENILNKSSNIKNISKLDKSRNNIIRFGR